MSTSIKNRPRLIIAEFAAEIKAARIEVPNSEIIKFRNDKSENRVRKAYKVPLDFLRFRKDNGRIASDVLTYENNKGPLNEATDFGQTELKKFLEKKDPDPTVELMNSIIKEGQELPAIITADGFLINGNRRKMVMEKLSIANKGNADYKYLKVIILPGLGENEPPPSVEEIEQIENRYQFQRDGKAEYYNFDMALAVKRKLDIGMDLEEILLDDPNYESLKGNKLQDKIKKFRDEYLEPLKCIDKYLEFLKRPGHYNTVSEGRGDSQGRWQAFLDYYNSVHKKMLNEKERIKLGIEDGDEGKIENIAYRIIRKRDFAQIDKKPHQIMRDIPKLIQNPNSKKELFKLLKIGFDLPENELVDEEGLAISEKTKDDLWANKNARDLIWHLKKAYEYVEQKKEMDTPFELLTAALEKLNHPNMDVTVIEIERLNEAMKLSRDIQAKANELEHLMYDAKKSKDKLKDKFKKK